MLFLHICILDCIIGSQTVDGKVVIPFVGSLSVSHVLLCILFIILFVKECMFLDGVLRFIRQLVERSFP